MADLTPDDFINAGYKKFTSSLNNADFGLQKTVKDGQGNKAYFINIWVYDMRGMPYCKSDYAFRADVVYFENTSSGVTRTISVETSDIISIEDIEAFYARMYKVFGEVPDIHNN